MTTSPRPLPVYNPHQPLTVPYSDVIAARNAIIQLVQCLTDRLDPPSDYRQIQVRTTIATAVSTTGHDEFATLDDAVTWLRDLQLRLSTYFPPLEPGTYEGPGLTMKVSGIKQD